MLAASFTVRRMNNHLLPLGSPPPKLGTLLRCWPRALLSRGRFRDVRTFVLMIGHARSGSSLVGSLINAHRHALIAHELNVLHFVKRHFPRSALFWLLARQDWAFEQAGRSWTGYDYRVSGQWQGRCEKLLVLGDKHAGGASRVLGERPELLDRLRSTAGVPIKLIHIVRHPLDNIATLHRRQSLSLTEAVEYYVRNAATNARLLRDNPADALTVHLEDIINRPADELARLCAFLNLDAPSDYVADCAASVFASPRQTRTAVEWPTAMRRSLLESCQCFPFLERYLGDGSFGSSVPGESTIRRAA